MIKHPGKGRATIDANGIDRVFEVFAGAPTTFRKLVITGGGATTFEAGGGIRSDANLRVIRSRIAGNSAGLTGGGIAFGLGLENGVGLKLIRSVVARNEAGSNGGGIRGRGAIELIHSRIVRNAGRFGGGLALQLFPTERSRIVASTIAGNRATEGGGGVRITDDGSGVDITDPPLRINGATISGNSAADDGGGLSLSTPARLVNSTVASNRAAGNGGGIWVGGEELVIAAITFNAVTVARNVADSGDTGAESGGGIYRDNAPSFEVQNSLIARNRLGSGQSNDCAGDPFDSLGHNLLSTRGPAGACEGFGRATDGVRSNPGIGKLKRNGGPTRTIALLRRSPALNEAKRSTAPNRDQRGKRRGRKKDIGAYEHNAGR